MITEVAEIITGEVVGEPGAATVAIEAGRDLVVPTAPRHPSQNPYHVYIASLASAESRRKMTRHLDQIACIALGIDYMYDPDKPGMGAIFPWEQLRHRHTAAIRAALTATDLSPSTINASLTALRRVLQSAWSLELISTDDRARAQAVRDVKGHRVPAGRGVSGEEVLRLRDACLGDGNPRGLRDAVLITVLASTGLREAEATAARIEDFDAVERSLKIIGKGNKQRIVYLHGNAADALGRWLAVTDARSGPIFRAVDKWGRIAGKPLTGAAVRHIVKCRRIQAGVRPLTVHDLRRTFIGNVLDAGAHLPQVQELVGHSNADTTSKYVRHNARALRAAVDRLDVPPMPEARAA